MVPIHLCKSTLGKKLFILVYDMEKGGLFTEKHDLSNLLKSWERSNSKWEVQSGRELGEDEQSMFTLATKQVLYNIFLFLFFHFLRKKTHTTERLGRSQGGTIYLFILFLVNKELSLNLGIYKSVTTNANFISC